MQQINCVKILPTTFIPTFIELVIVAKIQTNLAETNASNGDLVVIVPVHIFFYNFVSIREDFPME